jgi:hypothetical protein
MLVFNVKVKQFDFLCPLYPHVKTTPFWAPNFNTHPTQNGTVLGIKLYIYIYILKKKRKKKNQVGSFFSFFFFFFFLKKNRCPKWCRFGLGVGAVVLGIFGISSGLGEGIMGIKIQTI